MSLFKSNRKIFAVCQIANQTEEAESVNFSLNLYEGESDGAIREKLQRLFLVAEERRKFNNDRMNQKFEQLQKASEQLAVVSEEQK